MYLRHSTKRSNGKSYTYWKLVRSVRQGGRVRQEVVAHLGRLDAPAKRKASSLARHFLGPQADQPSLFEDDRDLPVAPVRLGDVRVERSRGFGDVWLVEKLRVYRRRHGLRAQPSCPRSMLNSPSARPDLRVASPPTAGVCPRYDPDRREPARMAPSASNPPVPRRFRTHMR